MSVADPALANSREIVRVVDIEADPGQRHDRRLDAAAPARLARCGKKLSSPNATAPQSGGDTTIAFEPTLVMRRHDRE